jgi:hypothetical protein
MKYITQSSPSGATALVAPSRLANLHVNGANNLTLLPMPVEPPVVTNVEYFTGSHKLLTYRWVSGLKEPHRQISA